MAPGIFDKVHISMAHNCDVLNRVSANVAALIGCRADWNSAFLLADWKCSEQTNDGRRPHVLYLRVLCRLVYTNNACVCYFILFFISSYLISHMFIILKTKLEWNCKVVQCYTVRIFLNFQQWHRVLPVMCPANCIFPFTVIDYTWLVELTSCWTSQKSNFIIHYSLLQQSQFNSESG